MASGEETDVSGDETDASGDDADEDDAPVPSYLLERDPEAYAAPWADFRLRRWLLISGIPYLVFGPGSFGISLGCFILLTWWAGGFRCPRCRERFAGRRLSLLLGRSCKSCGLVVGTRRDLTEPPMFPRFGNQ
jgi:hypothetical protein